MVNALRIYDIPHGIGYNIPSFLKCSTVSLQSAWLNSNASISNFCAWSIKNGFSRYP